MDNNKAPLAADDVDGWMGILDDDRRAEVLKVRIAETEQTKRIAIQSAAAIRQALFATEGYHVFRYLLVVTLFTAVIGACATTCSVSDHRNDLELERARLEHPPVPASITKAGAPDALPPARASW